MTDTLAADHGGPAIAHGRTDAAETLPSGRPLSLFESFFAEHSATMWITARATGSVDLDTLRAAWSLLRQAHPVLTGTIVPGEGGLPGFELRFPAELQTSQIAVREEADPQHSSRPLADGGPVSLVEVAVDERETLVSLAVHHAIADGRLALHWKRELWAYYTELSEGRAAAVEPRPVPKSPENLLAERGIAKTDIGPARSELVTPSEPPATEPRKTGPWRRILLSAADTAKMRAHAKSRGQTMHGLVTGAVALAVRRFLPASDGRAVDIVLSSPVDIRGRMDPAVPVWGGTNVLGIADSAVSVRPDSDPVAVGAEVIRQVTEDIETGAIYQSFLLMADGIGKPRPKAPQAMTTNVGVLDDIPTPRGVAVTELQGVLASDWARVVAMSEAAGHQVDHPLLTGWVHVILTYAGRMSIDFLTHLPDDQERGYTATLEALLLDMAERG